ncbi:MAG: reverse transcriptase family protein [Planctomycetes bacterium]|nr:reverse transcriptase family protein [Planctomycetota bacterium]
MGLFDLLKRLVLGNAEKVKRPVEASRFGADTSPHGTGQAPPKVDPRFAAERTGASAKKKKRKRRGRRKASGEGTAPLKGLRAPSSHKPAPPEAPRSTPYKPYAAARTAGKQYIDARAGGSYSKLARYGLPGFETPEDLARWLKIPLKTLCWLSDYHGANRAEKASKKQHYRYVWVKKNSGRGHRLIEAPKPMLKHIQERILRELLDKVPPHRCAHGFAKGRSIATNAAQHAGKYVILKVDLQDFYPRVTYKRVAAIFRALGYNREVARWLARLCTNAVPWALQAPRGDPRALLEAHKRRHLPQGAPTSPALANLAAWALDVRLNGLAKKLGATYTRYADDLTFSGGAELMKDGRMDGLIRWARSIVRNERFTWHKRKKRVIRRGNRQQVTGLTVNEKPNVPRPAFERLKAILHNCAKKGPAGQNHGKHDNFREHLLGRIAFVRSVNPQKAKRLQKVFEKISW